MRPFSRPRVGALLGAFMLSVVVSAPAENKVSGNLIVDGRAVTLKYAYMDEADAAEPIIVLSDQPLPEKAIPFIPEKLLKEKRVHAIAFTVSRKDKKLVNGYGVVLCPGHETGIGFGRVEEGKTKLTITRLDEATIEGNFSTTKPVSLSSVSYSFDMTFKVESGKKKP
jgi:hypothetical protein